MSEWKRLQIVDARGKAGGKLSRTAGCDARAAPGRTHHLNSNPRAMLGFLLQGSVPISTPQEALGSVTILSPRTDVISFSVLPSGTELSTSSLQGPALRQSRPPGRLPSPPLLRSPPRACHY